MAHPAPIKTIAVAIALATLFAVAGCSNGGPGVTGAGSTSNPIVIENQRTGSADVLLNLKSRYSSETIAGYADATSVNRGGRVSFKVSTSQPAQYSIDVYRLGYYAGLSARQVADSGLLDGITQTPCMVTDRTTRLLECAWDTSYTLSVGSDWVSGIYMAKLIHAATGKEYPIYFIVRDDNRRSDIVFQSSRTTALAYTNWGNATEKYSLYTFNSTNQTAAYKVSFDRPSNDGSLLNYEFPMLRWLESQGYDVTYISDMDLQTDPGLLLKHKVFLSVGHDEYWSEEMRAAVEAARDAGVNLGFFSANTLYWRVRFEPSGSGVPDRVMVCYKSPRVPDPLEPTYRWRDPPNNRPENALLGVMTIGGRSNEPYGGYDWMIANASDPYFANTDLSDGATLTKLYGYEWDAVVDNGYTPPGLVILGASPVVPAGIITGIPHTDTQIAHAIRYTHSSGARVFATGSIQWMWGLDSTLVNSPRVDRRAQQFAVNVLSDMGANPLTPDSRIVVPAPSELLH
jgi:hypothetical protein